MLNKIIEAIDPAKAWKECQDIKPLFWTLWLVKYPSLVSCELSNKRNRGSENCQCCAGINGWTADDVRDWIPEFPL